MDWNEINMWIEESKPIFYEVSKELNFKLGFDTHYDALNFSFSLVKGKELHRLDFQPMENGVFIITKYIDTFPFLPNLFTLLHNVIPLFPFLAKTEYKKVGEIDKEVKGVELKKNIIEYINNAF